MTRLLSLAIAVMALVAAAGFGRLAWQNSAATPAAAPALVVEPDVAELGTVRQNETLTGSYSVVNRLPVAVDITQVMKSCSCADAEVEPRHLGPGETATLKMAWKTGTKRGAVSDKITLVATTASPTPQTVFAELRLTCDVQPDVVIEPATPTFTEGTPATVVLHLQPGAVGNTKVKQCFSSTKTIRVTADVDASTVTVAYDPTIPLADDNLPTIMIETTSTREPWIRVPVTIAPIAKETK